jgi:hypothetical protein
MNKNDRYCGRDTDVDIMMKAIIDDSFHNG